MPYLIDGHNLIAHLPDIDLADPDDEAKLVLKLRGFCARHRKNCVVIFDQGLPGGASGLSTHSVAVIFASYEHTTADALIHERIRQTRDIKGWIVVSSDQEVLESADRHGMRGLRASDFANKLKNEPIEFDASTAENLRVSKEEVNEWLQHFREVEHDEPTAPAAKLTPRSDAPTEPPVNPSRQSSLPPFRKMPAEDVDQWMAMFGEEGARPPTDRAQRIRPRNAPPEPKQKSEPAVQKDKSGAPLFDRSQKEDAGLSKNTVDAWLSFFGDVDATRPPTDPAFQRDDPSKQGRYKTKDGKRAPVVHRRMATAVDLHLSSGEVDAWLDVFGYSEDTADE
jgi:hypothetical protein